MCPDLAVFSGAMQSVLNRLQLDAEEYVARIVTKINAELRGAYVFSSGKNMGTFKRWLSGGRGPVLSP